MGRRGCASGMVLGLTIGRPAVKPLDGSGRPRRSRWPGPGRLHLADGSLDQAQAEHVRQPVEGVEGDVPLVGEEPVEHRAVEAGGPAQLGGGPAPRLDHRPELAADRPVRGRGGWGHDRGPQAVAVGIGRARTLATDE